MFEEADDANPLDVTMSLVGNGTGIMEEEADTFLKALDDDARRIITAAVQYKCFGHMGHESHCSGGGKPAVTSFMPCPPRAADLEAELSVVLCDLKVMTDLNLQWRGKGGPTDVLSFPQEGDGGVLGDIVICVPVAAQQAEERGTTLVDELRILLVHGLLHLMGFDHETGAQDAQIMRRAESSILSVLGFNGEGLVAMADEREEDSHSVSNISVPHIEVHRPPPSAFQAIKVVALDMDGTLLNSSGLVDDVTAKAIARVQAAGIQVILATGKGRVGAARAAHKLGINLDIQPGVYLNGLVVAGKNGEIIQDDTLSWPAVESALEYHATQLTAGDRTFALTAFCGDRMFSLDAAQKYAIGLHNNFFEPTPEQFDDADSLLREARAAGGVNKMIVLGDPDDVVQELRPYWEKRMRPMGTELTSAHPTMIEILPPGGSKGNGLSCLLDHMGLRASQLMAFGDGENDLTMLQLAGISVAMGNAVPQLGSVADFVSGSNDDMGVARGLDVLLEALSQN